MDIRALIEFYYLEIYLGTAVTVVVTMGYGILAPWYRNAFGIQMFGLLASLSGVLVNFCIRITFPRAEWSLYVGAVLFGLFILSMTTLGFNIYKSQLKRFVTKEEVKGNGLLRN